MAGFEDAIQGARARLRVATPAEHAAWARRVRAQLGLAGALGASGVALAAHVSAGRWVVDCACGSAALAEPDWPTTVCADCGTSYPVVFPADRAAVEAALLRRPVAARNYLPDAAAARRRGLARAETLEDLLAENAAHGLGA